MTSYERQLRELLTDAIRTRAADFNNALHYGAALQLVAQKFGHAEIRIVLSVCDDLLKEGVLWL